MPAIVKPPRFRLLIVEDNPDRVELFHAWAPKDTQIVWARSGGSALGLIQRDPGYVYGGVLLDHDLNEQAMTDVDLTLSGTQVAEALIRYFSFEIPVLVHSTNLVQAPLVVSRLEQAGFWATHIPMYYLTSGVFGRWLSEAIDLWDARQN